MAKEFKISTLRLKELEQELFYLKTTREKEVAEQIKEARSFGDLSENSEYDEAKTVESTIEIPVSVCGKLRGVISVPADADKDTVIAAAKADEKVQSFISGKTIVKEIFVPGRMVNIVVK